MPKGTPNGRFRVIKPEFWSDRVVQGFTPTTQLIYMGLWVLSDDAGYFIWDEEQIRTRLQPSVSEKTGARRVRAALDELLGAGKVKKLKCGRHGIATKVPKHLARGRPMYRIRTDHQNRCEGANKPLYQRSPNETLMNVGPQMGSRSRGIIGGAQSTMNKIEPTQVVGTNRTLRSNVSKKERTNVPSESQEPRARKSSFDEAMPGLRQRLKAEEGT